MSALSVVVLGVIVLATLVEVAVGSASGVSVGALVVVGSSGGVAAASTVAGRMGSGSVVASDVAVGVGRDDNLRPGKKPGKKTVGKRGKKRVAIHGRENG